MQKTPKKNVTMGIGFNLRLISKLVLVTIWNYKIVPMKNLFFLIGVIWYVWLVTLYM